MNVKTQIVKRVSFHGIRNANLSRVVLRLRQKLLRRLPVRKKNLLKSAKGITLVFVGESEGRKINFKFRKINHATDILSFAPVEPGSLGELVFCVPVLIRQAKEHGVTLQGELKYLLIHGLLHLFGYEHERSESKARSMYKLQDELFAEMMGQ